MLVISGQWQAASLRVYLPNFSCPDNTRVDISFCVCWLRSVLPCVSLVRRGRSSQRSSGAPIVMRFCLWLSPLASLACHAKPQHPGDRDNRRSLPSGQSRVLIDTEPGKWLSVKSDQGDILRIVDILVFYFSKTGILIFLIQILMAFIHTNW